MKNNKLSELTIEELNKRKKILQGATIGFGIVMVIALAILVYLMFRNRNFTLVAIIPACLIVLLPGIINLSKINSEIKTRNSK